MIGKKFADGLSFGMLESMVYYEPQYNQTSDHSVISTSWNELQISMKCCGVNKYTDWDRNPSLNETNSVPITCCKELKKDCGVGKLKEKEASDIFTDGCLENFFDVVSENKNGVIIAFSIIFVAQLIVSTMACYLGKNMKKRKYKPLVEERNTETSQDEHEEE